MCPLFGRSRRKIWRCGGANTCHGQIPRTHRRRMAMFCTLLRMLTGPWPSMAIKRPEFSTPIVNEVESIVTHRFRGYYVPRNVAVTCCNSVSNPTCVLTCNFPYDYRFLHWNPSPIHVVFHPSMRFSIVPFYSCIPSLLHLKVGPDWLH